MAITETRYAEIDAELEQVCDRLIELAFEINRTALYQYCATYNSAISALGGISMLRHMLACDLEEKHIEDEIRRRSG